jgi:homocitrate synthase NifV
MNHIPYLLDTTLRDGEQQPGVVFTRDEKLSIVDLLDQAGIPEAEIGTPALGNDEIEDMKEITAHGFRLKTIAWCRALKEDVDKAEKTGTQGIHISFPVSSIHLKSMGKDETWVLQQLHRIIPYAEDRFEYVTVGLQDASRADYRFLKEVLFSLQIYNIYRTRIADTVGILNPFSTIELISALRRDFPDTVLEFHAHNDLGMATANSLAAFKAGAVCIDTTVNGLGERAGNAALEEFVMAMDLSLGVKIPFRTELILELVSLVSQASGIPVPVNKPVTGPGVICHEAGIHTQLLLKDRSTYQIIPAARIGRHEEEFVFGKHSGIHALQNFAERHRLRMAEDQYRLLINMIKSESARLKRSLTEPEVIAMIARQQTA